MRVTSGVTHDNSVMVRERPPGAPPNWIPLQILGVVHLVEMLYARTASYVKKNARQGFPLAFARERGAMNGRKSSRNIEEGVWLERHDKRKQRNKVNPATSEYE